MKTILIIFISLIMTSFIVRAQAFSMLKGKLHISNEEISSIKIILYNNSYRDTVLADTALLFHFENIPYGIYNMIVNANYTVTGRQNLLVTDILVNEGASIDMFTIKLSGTKTCGCGAFFLGKKDTVEYYKTGEVYGRGHYQVSKKYYTKYKSVKYSYRKQGLWNYYYKSGKLLRQAIYDSEYLVSINDFYENGKKKIVGYYDDCKSKVWEYYSVNGDKVFVVDFSIKFTTKISYKYLKGYMENFEMMEDL